MSEREGLTANEAEARRIFHGASESEAAEVDVSRVLWKAGGNLPAFLEVDGRGVVMVDAAEYRELVAARSKVLQSLVEAPDEQAGKQVGISTIERDIEVARFLRASFRGGLSVEKLRLDCLVRFGEDRTPSVNRIQKYRQRAIGKMGGRS